MVLDDRAHNPLIMRYEPSAVMDDLHPAALQEPSATSRSYSAFGAVSRGCETDVGSLVVTGVAVGRVELKGLHQSAVGIGLCAAGDSWRRS
jgi:hypothetical protein